MKRLLASVMLVAIILFAQIGNIKAEGLITDSTIINEQDDELFSYDVIYKDFHQVYTPEMFNHSEVVDQHIEKSDYMEWDDSYTYKFADGYELCISSGLNLFYYDASGDYYSQILTYLNTVGFDADHTELTGFSVKEATEQCGELMSRLGLGDLVLDTTVTFSKERLVQITDEMKQAYRDHPKVLYFTSFTDETEAYYLTYRQVLNGIKPAGTPQAHIVITRDGIAYLEITRVIDQIIETRPVTEQMSWQEAVACFEKKNINVYSIPDSISVSYEIREISIAYSYEFDMQNDPFLAHVFPGWYILGYETMQSEDQIRTHPIRDFYRIPDGAWYYPD